MSGKESNPPRLLPLTDDFFSIGEPFRYLLVSNSSKFPLDHVRKPENSKCIGISVMPSASRDMYTCYVPGSEGFVNNILTHPRTGVFMKIKGCWELVGGPAFRKCIAIERKHCKQTKVAGYYLEEIASLYQKAIDKKEKDEHEKDPKHAVPKLVFGQAALIGAVTFYLNYGLMYDVPGSFLDQPAYDHVLNSDGGIYQELYDHWFSKKRNITKS